MSRTIGEAVCDPRFVLSLATEFVTNHRLEHLLISRCALIEGWRLSQHDQVSSPSYAVRGLIRTQDVMKGRFVFRVSFGSEESPRRSTPSSKRGEVETSGSRTRARRLVPKTAPKTVQRSCHHDACDAPTSTHFIHLSTLSQPEHHNPVYLSCTRSCTETGL